MFFVFVFLQVIHLAWLPITISNSKRDSIIRIRFQLKPSLWPSYDIIAKKGGAPGVCACSSGPAFACSLLPCPFTSSVMSYVTHSLSKCINCSFTMFLPFSVLLPWKVLACILHATQQYNIQAWFMLLLAFQWMAESKAGGQWLNPMGLRFAWTLGVLRD